MSNRRVSAEPCGLRPDELIVDSFAGGGGASLGIEMALGRSPDIAINHDAEAIAVHAANHPDSKHYQEDVWRVDPVEACAGRPVGLMWLSPDCKHFSKAKGGKPVSKRVRGLAWVAVRWATAVRPRVIVLENVEEFQTWGPVVRETGMPCPVRKGRTFRSFVSRLRALGYVVEWRELRACDYGAPTIRKRLFLVARCDGQPIVWPKPTHGKHTAQPWRTAAECIDWSLPCPSIFDRKKPLADNTLRRIAAGLKRFVIDHPSPFIVRYRGEPERSAVSIDEPMPTVTANGWVKRPGGAAPLALATPFVVPTAHQGDSRAHSLEEPIRTITGGQRGDHALVAAFMAQHNTGNAGHPMEAPVSTIIGKGCTQALVTTQLDLPIATSHLVKLKGTAKHGQPVAEPLHTVQAGGLHYAEVRAFLLKYYGTDQDPRLEEPLHTLTTKERFALVMVDGQPYAIADIGMRMLAPRELYRAQGFPDTYRIEVPFNGKPLTKTAQVRMVGNSVCPPLAEAIVRANYGEREAGQVAA